MIRISLIVPVFNRPDEVEELLESCCRQNRISGLNVSKNRNPETEEDDFEIIIVEDGSTLRCEDRCRKFSDRLNLRYYYKDNSGPGMSRNYGAEKAEGEYLIVLDSDVVLPPDYITEVWKELEQMPTDAFGGPDRAHDSFTDTQKAINYSMTSFFTTGGIRGGKKKLDKFYPRSFNMGIRRDVYRALGGFSKMRFGEDIDFSIRIFRDGYRCRLFPEAWVWHKRRTDIKKFFRQVYNSGIARINLFKKYPNSLKPVHMLPAAFTVGVICMVLLSIAGCIMTVCGNTTTGPIMATLPWLPILLFILLIFTDSAIRNRSFRIGFISIAAAFVQLMGYGLGFIGAWWKRCVCGKDEFEAFRNTFYK